MIHDWKKTKRYKKLRSIFKMIKYSYNRLPAFSKSFEDIIIEIEKVLANQKQK